MPVRVDDPRPPYVQLAAELRDAIKAGDYEPGDRLPSTRRLAEANGISPMTVQHALRVLKDEGLVVSHQGRGAFVQEPTEEAAGEDTTSTPRTLDEALKMLAEVNARLDQLEARVAQPEHRPGPDPAPEETHGIDL
jgi:DNA-binding GntR family transcriptional regulator